MFLPQKPRCTRYNGIQISSKMMFKCFAWANNYHTQFQASRPIGFLEFFFSVVLSSTEDCMFSAPACEELFFFTVSPLLWKMGEQKNLRFY